MNSTSDRQAEPETKLPFWVTCATDGERALEHLDWGIRETKRLLENAINRALIAIWHCNVPAENTIALIAAHRQELGVLEHLRARTVKLVEQLKAKAA